MPELKAFLKGGEAESYEGIEIEYIHGRQAILTIYDAVTDAFIERVELSKLTTKDEMHKLFVEKGFVLKSPEEVAKIKEQRQQEILDEKARKKERIARARKLKEERMGDGDGNEWKRFPALENLKSNVKDMAAATAAGREGLDKDVIGTSADKNFFKRAQARQRQEKRERETEERLRKEGDPEKLRQYQEHMQQRRERMEQRQRDIDNDDGDDTNIQARLQRQREVRKQRLEELKRQREQKTADGKDEL